MARGEDALSSVSWPLVDRISPQEVAMTQLSRNTTVAELIEAYPYLIEDLPSRYPRLAPLRNPAARAAMASIATLERASMAAGVSVEEFLQSIADMVRQRSGHAPDIEPAEPATDRQERIVRLKEIIKGLHEGGSLEEARRQFHAVAGTASAREIAEMEQQLLREGVPVEEIQRLCDLHVHVFRLGLDRQGPAEAPAGHPVHTYMAENRVLEQAANRLVDLCRRLQAGETVDQREALAVLEDVRKVDLHYTRKEHQLFPALEAHGFTGPSQVMWAHHDDIRARVKALIRAVEAGDLATVVRDGWETARRISEMVYKEEHILFPAALSVLSDEEWVRMRQGDDAIGYIVPPAAEWPAASTTGQPGPAVSAGEVPLSTGSLTVEQLDRMLTSLPVEISFVDDQDTVRFYSDHAERIFPRSPGDIGRAVQNCHPPKSLHKVQAILSAFRAGTRDTARFWINFQGRKILITYHAVRSKDGRYLGCMEVTQDITDIQALEGERRLLEWD